MLDDSKRYLILARDCSRKKEDELMLSYCRSVFLSSWSALEGWINYIAYSFAKTDQTLNHYEIAFLLEQKIEVDDNGEVKILKQAEFHPTLKKLLFIMRKFGNNFDFKHCEIDLWRNLREIERTRHSIVHPKDREQDFTISLTDAEKCFATVVKTVELLKDKIFGA